jgi:hypothetical protein
MCTTQYLLVCDIFMIQAHPFTLRIPLVSSPGSTATLRWAGLGGMPPVVGKLPAASANKLPVHLEQHSGELEMSLALPGVQRDAQTGLPIPHPLSGMLSPHSRRSPSPVLHPLRDRETRCLLRHWIYLRSYDEKCPRLQFCTSTVPALQDHDVCVFLMPSSWKTDLC